MKKIIIILGLILAVSACDNSSSPEPKDINDYKNITDFMPLAEANWWLYENYEIDEDNNLSEDFSLEKQIIIEVFEENDTTFTIIDIEDGETGEYISTTDYKFIDNKVFTTQLFNINVPFLEDELMLVDYDENEWIVIDNPNLQIDMLGIPINGEILGEAQKSYQDDLLINGKTIQCQTIDYKFTFSGSLTFNGQNVNVVTDIEAKIWLGLKTGITRMKVDPTLINAGLFTQTMPGSDMILVDYQIN